MGAEASGDGKEGRGDGAGKDGGRRSRFRGVSYHPPSRKWMARISKDGKRTTLGYFDREDEAGACYARARGEGREGGSRGRGGRRSGVSVAVVKDGPGSQGMGSAVVRVGGSADSGQAVAATLSRGAVVHMVHHAVPSNAYEDVDFLERLMAASKAVGASPYKIGPVMYYSEAWRDHVEAVPSKVAARVAQLRALGLWDDGAAYDDGLEAVISKVRALRNERSRRYQAEGRADWSEDLFERAANEVFLEGLA